MRFVHPDALWWLLALLPFAGAAWWTLVDRPLAKRWSAFALRALAVVALILAIARPYCASPGDELHVAFVVDLSASVDLDAAEAALTEIEQAAAALGPDDTWSLVAVAQEARPTTIAALRETLAAWKETGISEDAFRSESRLGEGLLAARLAFPSGKARRAVVFSDGQDTRDSLAAALDLLRDEGVEVLLRRLPGLDEPEVLVASLRASTSSAFAGEIVRLTARVQGNRDGVAKLRVLHQGVAVVTREVQVTASEPVDVLVDVPMHTPGRSVWIAEVEAADDHFAINNQAQVTVTVRGQPRVLFLHEKPRELRPFARALREQGFAVDVRTRRGLPETTREMLAFDAIALAGIPATALSERDMQRLERYVSEFGGALLMFGSEDSFGLGGYYQTPVEQVLPLTSRFEKEKEQPSIAIALVLDKSGSMSGLPIALARQAARAVVDLLSDQDRIAVLAFDSAAFVASPMRSAGEGPAIKAAIDEIGAGGGTFMYPAMAMAVEVLGETDAKVRHMILLGDGQTQPADHLRLTQDAVDQGITVSAVALGAGADQALLSQIAELGRGRYYETLDPANVPQIFTKETMQASRSAIKEDLFPAVKVGSAPFLANYDEAELPMSLGYVMTRAKPTGEILLATDGGDPLLAVMRYGLGAGLAYTSDLTERWGGEWLAWEGCGRFWAEALRGVVRKQDAPGVTVETRATDAGWEVAITKRDRAGALESDIRWDGQLLQERGGRAPAEVEAVGLGRYRVRVPDRAGEATTLRLFEPASDVVKVVHLERGYPREYRLQSELPAALAEVPVLANARAVRDDVPPVERKRPLGPWLMVLAMGLVLGSTFFRRY